MYTAAKKPHDSAVLLTVSSGRRLLCHRCGHPGLTRTGSGGLAGLVGQPAILAFALSKRDDERIEAGYATLFALAIVVKIVMVQVLVAL